MSHLFAAAVAWVLFGTGALVWAGILLWALSGPFWGSGCITFGCARCEWDVPNPKRIPRWLLQLRYRQHCVAVHRDWPPQYTRTDHRRAS